ncbi:DUF1275 domain-containing protein [Candidatus Poribacteria bacterium]|nr:DUF1275 domain-containing protein [Candidatus Poribacteria bacterium]
MFKKDNRTFQDNLKLGGIFVFLGGYTGILTALILGHFVNCMSGNATETGISLGKKDIPEALLFCSIVLAFIFGAFLAAKAIDKIKYGYIPILITESILLISIRNFLNAPALVLSSLAMGLQNGLTSYTTWSSGKIRTTHVTGTTTDIGVSLAKKDMHEIGFNVFQAIMYLSGAILAFFITRKFGNQAFTLAGIAILVILLVDTVHNYIKK